MSERGWICPVCARGVAPTLTRCPCVDDAPKTLTGQLPPWKGGPKGGGQMIHHHPQKCMECGELVFAGVMHACKDKEP